MAYINILEQLSYIRGNKKAKTESNKNYQIKFSFLAYKSTYLLISYNRGTFKSQITALKYVKSI